MKRDRSSLRIVLRLAAGPRLGFGHLVRGRTLARALGVRSPWVSLRGGAAARAAARRFGVRLIDGTPSAVLIRTRPDVLVIDDPSATFARPWVRAARRLAIRVASVHDLGLAYCGADLTIDGSLEPPRFTPGLLAGPDFAILDDTLHAARRLRRKRGSVLIALGGGPRLGVGLRIARALKQRRPELDVRLACGFAAVPPRRRAGITCLGPLPGLADELARCGAAVTGGGVSLYEAMVLGTATVAWPVVAAQERTVRAFGRRGLAAPVLVGPRRITRCVDAVLAALARAECMTTSRVIDGHGAERVAAAVEMLARPMIASMVDYRPAPAASEPMTSAAGGAP